MRRGISGITVRSVSIAKSFWKSSCRMGSNVVERVLRPSRLKVLLYQKDPMYAVPMVNRSTASPAANTSSATCAMLGSVGVRNTRRRSRILQRGAATIAGKRSSTTTAVSVNAAVSLTANCSRWTTKRKSAQSAARKTASGAIASISPSFGADFPTIFACSVGTAIGRTAATDTVRTSRSATLVN